MGRFLAIVMLSSVAIAQLSFAAVQSDQNAADQKAAAESVSTPASAPRVLPPLPPAPPGRSTVIGGAIRNVDPVRDRITLKVFGGGRPMTILFDERTHFYRDGVRTPLRDLHPDGHASVETVLDGTSVYARSIHILSQEPEGEFRGQVLGYNPSTGDLTVNNAQSNHPMVLRVPAGTPIVRRDGGSSTSSDLVKGTLVAVDFKSANNGRGAASHIEILATPGSTFVFTGTISFLDLHAHTLALVDPRDNQSYKISFDPALFPASQNLRQGSDVRVSATFNGTDYVASAISIK